MLYKKNNTKKLDMELFKNPTAEYRGTPFWAWNCKLDKDMLMRQIEYLKEMGFGGFHMHSRSGMATKYLSEEFMDLVKACRDKAKKENMLAWLYDEDRWSSGSAGGYVTKNKAFREKMLVWSENPVEFVDKETGVKNGVPYLVAIYDVTLDENGKLKSYKRIEADEKADGIKRFAYVKTAEERGWYNNQTYVDTLSKEAMHEFIKITYESYNKSVGEDFGDLIPAIFTDEPQFSIKGHLKFAHSDEDVSLPWTTDFPETYKAKYSEDILDRLPELYWDLADNKISQTRYRYHDHVCERFTESFADQCGSWCKNHNLALTGHMLFEPTLESQTRSLGEAMRAYRSFGIPGIDMLCDWVELTTAKQAQSAVHQYNREAMLSELYGVTNWDFDFRGHKFQGDWQAALGVTVRVPHLSWVSMKGSAKRDYPASINYQSPWYKDYSYVEDHFARLNTVLTRGKPIVDVAVIHPVESYWLHFGPADTNSDVCKKLDNRFMELTEWLLTGMVDFDFISESLFPEQCGEVSSKLQVGAMEYKTVIVPGCETIRRTTFEILKRFKKNGGRLIFLGECPKYIDAYETDEVKELYDISEQIEFGQIEMLNALKKERTAEVLNENGETIRNFVHTLRQDGDVKWLFMAHCVKNKHIDVIEEEKLTIIIDGEYVPKLYDTVNASVLDMDYETKNGKTYIYKTVFPYDSLLIQLTAGTGYNKQISEQKIEADIIDFKKNVCYKREEDNVYVLDMAEYSLDNEEFKPLEEIIIIDDKCREILKYPAANGEDAQPWVLGEDKIEHFVTLRFTVMSSTVLKDICIAAEEAESISVNGQTIRLAPCGYFVDESIKKYYIGTINQGENIIEIKAPIGKRTSIENFFLVGDFDVSVKGCEKILSEPSDKIGFSDITSQGMPFYGGNLLYKTEIETPECELDVRVSRYRGAAVKIYLDGEEKGIIAYPPYMLKIDDVKEGTHKLEFKFLGNRVNTFGALHACDYNPWFGPEKWYTYKRKSDTEQKYEKVNSSKWSYEYVLKETGIISSPTVCILKKN